MTDGVVNNLIWYGDAPDDWPECRIKDVARLSPPLSQNKPDDFEPEKEAEKMLEGPANS